MRRAIALLAVVPAAVACSSSAADPAPTSPPPSSTAAPVDDAGQDAALAAALCRALRNQTNLLARLANSAVAGIGAMEPADRFTALVGGFDDVEAAGQDFRSAIDALDLPPDVPEAGDLRAEIGDGAALAVAEVQRVRTAFIALSPLVRDEDVQGRVGQLFNAVEKMMSVVEPAMAGYPRRELRAAFAAEPACEHVVQPVGTDD
ncbi:MAG: hypothetical protein ACR2HP_13330 [Ilumatobacteraceae bacterium]